MPPEAQRHNIAAIRKLLLDAFKPEDLRRFCQDRPILSPIVTRFGPGHGLDDMVDEVIDYCKSQLLWEDLLAEVERENPRQYARFAADLYLDHTAPIPVEAAPRPSLALTLSVQPQTVYSGEQAMWAAAVKNDGDEDLEQITVRHGQERLAEPAGLAVGRVGQFRFVTTYHTLGRKIETVTATTTTGDDRHLLIEASAEVQVQEPPPAAMTLQDPIHLELVWIPAGEFAMGSDPADDKRAGEQEQPQHRVYVSGFYMGRYPVTNLQYSAFVQETGQAPPHWKSGKVPPGKDKHPVVNVSWYDALAFCEWLSRKAGKLFRLPTEAEWEKAARGTDGRIYPWGNRLESQRCHSSTGVVSMIARWTTAPVGQYSPAGDSPYGVADMSGNTWEWCHSLFKPYPYRQDDGREDPQSAGERVLRGGTYLRSDWYVRCAARYSRHPTDLFRDGGFRVALDLPFTSGS